MCFSLAWFVNFHVLSKISQHQTHTHPLSTLCGRKRSGMWFCWFLFSAWHKLSWPGDQLAKKKRKELLLLLLLLIHIYLFVSLLSALLLLLNSGAFHRCLDAFKRRKQRSCAIIELLFCWVNLIVFQQRTVLTTLLLHTYWKNKNQFCLLLYIVLLFLTLSSYLSFQP